MEYCGMIIAYEVADENQPLNFRINSIVCSKHRPCYLVSLHWMQNNITSLLPTTRYDSSHRAFIEQLLIIKIHIPEENICGNSVI